MNEKKILPVKYPRITCHLGTAGLMSILECIPESVEWMYTNFIGIESFDLCTGYFSGTKDLVLVPGYDFSYILNIICCQNCVQYLFELL